MAGKRKFSKRDKKAYYVGLGVGLTKSEKFTAKNSTLDCFSTMSKSERESYLNGYEVGSNISTYTNHETESDCLSIKDVNKKLKRYKEGK